MLADRAERHHLSQEVRVWITSDSAADVKKVLQKNLEYDFQPSPKNGLVFPYRKCSYWLWFKVENKSAFQRFFLEIANLTLYDLRLYRKSGQELILVGQGGYKMENLPTWNTNFYSFEIAIAQDSTSEFYLFANTGRSGSSIFLPMRIVESGKFMEMVSNKRWVEGIMFGAGIIILLFGCVLFIANRDKASAWMLAFMLSSILYVSANNGALHHLFWGHIHYYTRLWISLSAILVQISASYLFIHFHGLKNISPKLVLFLKSFIAIGLVLFVFQARRYFYETSLGDTFMNNIQSLFFVTPITLIGSSFWMAIRFKNKKFLVFPAVWIFSGLLTVWKVTMGLGYHSYGLFYRDLVINLYFLIDFTILLAWFSYEMLLLKTNHSRQQIALAESRTQAAENLLRGQQEERRRLRFRLHDGLGILLANLRMRASKLARQNEAWRSIETDIALAAREARLLSHDLEPEILREGRLQEAIEDTIGRMRQLASEQGELSFHFTYHVDTPLSPGIVNTAYYISQELLLNAYKHAEASEIYLSLDLREGQTLVIRLEDDGKGMGTETTVNGIGIENIHSRVVAANGTFDMKNRAGGGLLSEVKLPLR